MKLKELNLNKPHYIIAIWTSNSKVLVTKAKYSTIEKSKYLSPQIDCFFIYPCQGFFIYPCQESKNSYVNKPIVSLSANPEEIIFEGGHYIKFNQQYKYQLSYIAFDLATMIQLIHDYFKEKYYAVKREEGTIYRKNYSKDIQEMYKQFMKQIKQIW
jgi:hypothetical protein